MGLLKSLAFIVWYFLFGSFMYAMAWNEQKDNYESQVQKNCEQYLVVPKEYIERVPSSCVPLYFERNGDTDNE